MPKISSILKKKGSSLRTFNIEEQEEEKRSTSDVGGRIERFGEVVRQLSSEDRERFEQLYKSSKLSIVTTINLVNDLLDYAKIENASFKIFPSFINLSKTVDKALSTLEHLANLKKIKI